MSRFNKPIDKHPGQLSFLEEPSPEPAKQPAREIGAYRNTDPDTSEAAAKSLDVTKLEAKIYEAIKSRPGGLTTREMAAVLGIDWGSITPRCKPMEAKGKIYRTDERRRWKSGRYGIVWKAIP
jgi:predicted transcriptional regulator